jgi:DNA-binding CsgD family transcriptional regulator/PAS domain-containing protein
LDLEGVGAAFAEAAVDPSKWPAAMNRVAKATNSYGALLVPVRGGPLPNVPFSQSLAPSFEAYVRDGWIHRDVRYRVTPVMARRGVATELDIVTADEIATHPYWQEFLGRFGLRWFAGVKVASGDDFWCCSIQRTIQQGPFSPGELTELAQMSAQLSSAAALARALGLARAEAALDAFGVSSSAVALLDRCGEVIRLNDAAERLLGSDLKVIHKRFVSRNADATAALDRALHGALWAETASALMPPVALPRAEKRPLLAHVVRLNGVSPDVLAPCQAVIVLIDLEARRRPPEDAVRVAFGLTAAEARLATRLASGEALETVADELGIAKETARCQLKAVFEKVGVHRQPEFVALTARLLNSNETNSTLNPFG